MNKCLTIIDIAKEMQAEDTDSIFLVVGLEGSGKSHLVLNFMDYLNATMKNISLDKEDFLKSLSDIEDGSCFQFDEAGDGLFSRDALSKTNKDLVKTFMVIRAKRLIGFMCLPSFFMLDTYFRRHRVRGLFYVYQRGRVSFFDRECIDKIIFKCERYQRIFGVRPIFTDSFPRYKGRLLEDYNKKKAEKIKTTLKSLKGEGEPLIDLSNYIKKREPKVEVQNEESFY